MKHQILFGHFKPGVRGPICRVCETEITAEIWASDPDCPGSPDEQLAKSTAMLMSVLK